MTRNQWLIIGVLGFAVVLVYCLGMVFVAQQFLGTNTQVALVPPTAEPTATYTPFPTWTPTPIPTPRPSATFVIAIPTRASPTVRATTVIGTRTAAAAAIENAWSKTETLKIFRFEIDFSAKGDLKGLPGVTGSNQEVSLFQITGATNYQDNQIVFKGLLSSFLGGDPNKGFEMVSVGGKAYIKGPMPMFGAPEDKWYNASSSFTSTVTDTDKVLKQTQTVNWNVFKKTTSETLDGRRCDVYVADKNASLDIFSTIQTQTGQTRDLVDALDNAETKMWICDDGYFHQLAMLIEGHATNQPTQKTAIRIKMRLFDINAPIKITAPANAVPMEAPSFMLSTPTPTRKP